MKAAIQYAQDNASRFEAELFDLLKIPSVSTDPAFAPQVRQAAEWVASDLRAIGVPNVEIIPTQRHPIVYGEWLGAGPDAHTVLIYGHYDVQPADRADGWHTEPFNPVVKDGFVYARGATDDKGQFFAHLKAVEALLKTEGRLPVNVKFLIEGEEESGGENLAKYVREHSERLRADVCIISDGSMPSIDLPTIVYSVRGIIGFEIILHGPGTDLHSGMYGGTVHNPIQALAEIIAQLHHTDGSVAVPGFYDDVLPLTPAEREVIANGGGYTFEQWQANTGAPAEWGEKDYTINERIGARPTLEITGFGGGYFGQGLKNVIPAKAIAKGSARLVANQDPMKIFELIKARIHALTPPTVRVEVNYIASGLPASVDINDPAMTAAVNAYKNGWGHTPVFKREGGSLPIVADLNNHVHMPVLLVGFGLDTDGIHGPNERFSLDMFHKGIVTSIHFLYEASRIK
jgi:acetylornithine deacetylase/succinyl-diaminopimelate desuccinylase-like protein